MTGCRPRVWHSHPPSGCTASAATLGGRGAIGSALVSMSTGELLLKESFVLLEKRKFRCQQWLTALGLHDLRKCGSAQGRGQSDPGVDGGAVMQGLLRGFQTSPGRPRPQPHHDRQAPRAGEQWRSQYSINCTDCVDLSGTKPPGGPGPLRDTE